MTKDAQGVADGNEREAFEREMRCEDVWGHRSLKRSGDGYVNSWVQLAWGVWQARAALANVQPKGSDKANEWRKLAQQFDGQRMAAMVHLRTLLAFPDTHAEAVRAFLAATPAEQIASVTLAQAPAVAHAPLTQEQIDQIVVNDAWDSARNPNESVGAWCARFARAIEAAHGIGKSNPPVQENDK